MAEGAGVTVGRKPVYDELGRMRSERPSTQRGFNTISIRDAVADQLTAYMLRHGISKKSVAIAHLLENEKPYSIPWDEIEEALCDALGKAGSLTVRQTIARLKAAQE